MRLVTSRIWFGAEADKDSSRGKMAEPNFSTERRAGTARAAFVYERRTKAPPELRGKSDITLRTALFRYSAAAVVVIATGPWLPFIGRESAEVMGWNTTFVGMLRIAGATSIPELVVTIIALRLRAVDMAIGNLLGSNLFDILVLAIDDIAYTKAPLLSSVSPANAITAFAAVIMPRRTSVRR
jgi:cation:H+ antiporter